MEIELGRGIITMRMPDDWHFHFRQGDMLKLVVRLLILSGWCGRVVAMPNPKPPILTAEQAVAYRNEIIEIARTVPGGEHLEPVMAIQITEETTPEMIYAAYRAGVRLGKIYPRNMTTHSENGVFDYTLIYPALAAMQEVGMVASFHGEHPSLEIEGMDKEKYFLVRILAGILKEFPKLKVVLEHITTADAVEFVRAHDMAATITIHHLMMTLDDVIGYSEHSGYLMQPHNFCKPVAKRMHDRDLLIAAAVSGDPKFFYGGDSAAHIAGTSKHCSDVCAGVFNTPAALPLLILLFDRYGDLRNLEPFLSEHGANFYGMPLNDRTITLRRERWKIPDEYFVGDSTDVVIPWLTGETMHWKVVV